MGYTHSWSVPQRIDSGVFEHIVRDCRKVCERIELAGVPLAGVDGERRPVFKHNRISFNGVRHCGHERRALGATWPTREAIGVNVATVKGETVQVNNTVVALLTGKQETLAQDSDCEGTWLAGVRINTRTCDGDCSYESFDFKREYDQSKKGELKVREDGMVHNTCKTAFRPYDIAVTACLLIARVHLGNGIQIHTDGEPQHWVDGYQAVVDTFPDYAERLKSCDVFSEVKR